MTTSLITYTDPSTQTIVSDIIFHNDTIWMTQDQMSKLYQTDTSGISRHIKKIYDDVELKQDETSQSESKLQKMQNSFKKPISK